MTYQELRQVAQWTYRRTAGNVGGMQMALLRLGCANTRKLPEKLYERLAAEWRAL